MIKHILHGIILSLTLLLFSACGGGGSSAVTPPPAVTYTVSFNSNGGSAVTSQSVTENTIATAPTAPTKTGYTFAGWYSNADLTAAFNFATAITANTVLYAKWTIIPPTSATLKINLSGDLAGKAISGAEFTLTLPANVTPTTVGGEVATSVVTPSGTFAGSSIAPVVTYTPAVGAAPGTVHVVVTNSVPTGVMTAGEVATINLQLSNGAAPVVTDFALNSVPVVVIDTLYNPIAGMTASVAGVTLQ
jgi:uncharacterized repeat protein (TIGR02543 family)